MGEGSIRVAELGIYRAPNGRVAEEILYRHDEPRLEVIEQGRP
jgi:hypothetical protein